MEHQIGMYMVIVKDGPTPPKCFHTFPSTAIREAERLSKKYNKPAAVVKVMAIVQEKEVPVTKKELVTTLLEDFKKELAKDGDLPF